MTAPEVCELVAVAEFLNAPSLKRNCVRVDQRHDSISPTKVVCGNHDCPEGSELLERLEPLFEEPEDVGGFTLHGLHLDVPAGDHLVIGMASPASRLL